jgi:23S rRNA maturation-related 3'-5' exoribonuclease YhaM
MIDAEKILANKIQIIQILAQTGRAEIESLITFLENSDFFTAPASTKYHGAYEGGLAEHSLFVWHVLKEKNKYYGLGLSEDTMAITALGHDLCKIGFYTKEMKSVLKGKIKVKKNKKVDGQWQEVEEEVNDWQQEEVWEVKDGFPVGHGEKSVITLLKYIQLSDLEIAMIRWHMGGYVAKDEYRDMSSAMEMYPAIVALFTADMEVSHLIKTGGEET